MALPTLDQIVALAPDAASIKAARDLAHTKRWPELGRDPEVLWGKASGSAAVPYEVVVLIGELATKCSCPSRKFPCKHALALLLLASQTSAALTPGARPPFVEAWLAGRAERERKSEERSAKRAADPAPAEPSVAQQKRRERRTQRVDLGIDLLRHWLADVVRRGLAADDVQDEATWRAMGQRLVDAQAQGLAARLAQVQDRVRQGPSQAGAVVEDLGRLHALLSAAGRRDRLAPDLAASLAQALGETVPSETVLARPGLVDEWFVAARETFERDRLVISRTWLLGSTSARWVMVLHAAPVHLRGGDVLPLGATLHGEACCYPGAVPLRALFRGTPVARPRRAPVATTFAEVLARHAAAVAREPWHVATPFLVNAHPGELAGDAVLVDEQGDALPASLRAAARALLHAVTGGRPAPVAGVFDGARVAPLAVDDATTWVDLAGSPR